MFFSRFKKRKKSGTIAKHRLQKILVSDRADCSSEIIEAIKEDICLSLTKYMDVDMKQINLDIISSNSMDLNTSQCFLIAKIPFRGINKVIC